MTKLGINPGAKLFKIKVTLLGVKPEIWRRLLVPGNIRLDMLHETIQCSMGWKDCHLHAFHIKGTVYGDPDNPPAENFKTERGTRSKLKFLDLQVGDKFLYVYDFGDDWVHEVLIEEISEPVPKETYPRLIGGERNCPPEDCGGPPGYESLLRILADPSDPQYGETLEWLGGSFDPEGFDPNAYRFIPMMLTYS